MEHAFTFKFDDAERRAIEAERKRLQQTTPGVEISIASAVRSLIRRAPQIDQQPQIKRVQ